jgi:CheY-like chemotaxis protein
MRRRILVVDDDFAVLKLMYAVLEGGGYDVLAAGGGPEGVGVFRRSAHPVDILVTDYNMPHMTGLEFARACWQFRPDVVVLFVSGLDPDAELRSELKASRRRLGKCAFLAKPFLGHELLHATRQLLTAGPVAGRALGSGLPALSGKEYTRCL